MVDPSFCNLTWLALGEDHAARSRRVEQVMALSDVCKALGGSFGVVHSKISDCGNLRTRCCPPGTSTQGREF